MENYYSLPVGIWTAPLAVSKILLRTFTCALLVSILFHSTTTAFEKDPISPIEATVNEILTILQSEDKSEWPGTRRHISEIIRKRFDFHEQSRRVLASYWDAISNKEREQFISLFSKLQEHVYLNRLRDYSDEQVNFTKHIIKGNKAAVFSVILKDAEEIPISYRMVKKEGGWFVYDVIIDGVSLVKNYRKQFNMILEEKSFHDLIVIMEEKIAKIEINEKEKSSTESNIQHQK